MSAYLQSGNNLSDVGNALTSLGNLTGTSGFKIGPSPSGDTTGATDTAAIAAAQPSAGTLVLPGTGYYVNKLPDLGPGQGFAPSLGLGCVIYHVDNGTASTCHHWWNPSFPVGAPSFVGYYTNNMPAKVGPFIIDGTNCSNAGSVGIQWGDIQCLNVESVHVRNYSVSGQQGWLGQSTVGWCEKSNFVNCLALNCANLVTFTDARGAHQSFDYSNYDFILLALGNQNGLTMSGNTQFQGVHLRIRGNFQTNSGSNTGVAWQIGPDNSAINFIGGSIDWQVENDGSTVSHKTITMGSGANIISCSPMTLKFGSASGAAWVAGGITQPNIKFTGAGHIAVDSGLGINQQGEGLNVLGGSTWSRGFSNFTSNTFKTGRGGDYFSVTLLNGSNVCEIDNTYAGRARRLLYVLKQPSSGAPGTVDWTNPGNNVQGTAQAIVWTEGGGAAPTLQTANNAVDVVELVTVDGVTWYGQIANQPIPTVPSAISAQPQLLPTGYIAQSMPSWSCNSNTLAAVASGTLRMVGIYLPINTTVSNITFVTGTTPGATITNVWAGLYDQNRVQLATTTTNTLSPAIAGQALTASTAYTAAISTIASGASATFTTTYSGLHYIGLMFAGTTSPTLTGFGGAGSVVTGLAPAISGSSDTGQTTPPAFAHTAGSLTALGGFPYVAVS